jgi:hypothetical protein
VRQFRGVARGRKSGLKFGAREEAEGTKIKLMGDWIKERNGEVKPTAIPFFPFPITEKSIATIRSRQRRIL